MSELLALPKHQWAIFINIRTENFIVLESIPLLLVNTFGTFFRFLDGLVVLQTASQFNKTLTRFLAG